MMVADAEVVLEEYTVGQRHHDDFEHGHLCSTTISTCLLSCRLRSHN